MYGDLNLGYVRAALVVDTGAIAQNVRLIRKIVGTKTAVMAVVKADGYGLGAEEVAKAALGAGAGWLGVSTVKEGLALREAGIDAPVLTLSPVFGEEFDPLVRAELGATVFSLETCRMLSAAAARQGKRARVHIKIDTGMNRVGYAYGDIDRIIYEITETAKLPGVYIEGVCSHLATSDTDATFAREQYSRFMAVVYKLEYAGIHVHMRHISNSGGVINHPELNLDMVRCGILTYGLAPCSTAEGARDLEERGFRQAFTLRSRVAHVKTVRQGEGVGYSRNYYAPRDIQVVTVPIGYADGISRRLSNSGDVLINGKICPIIGNVCMDQFMVDATDAGAKIRDEVIIIGESGHQRIWPEDIAGQQGSINYEVATSLALRVPRYYI